MIEENTFAPLLKFWHLNALDSEPDTCDTNKHLSDDELFTMASYRGFDNASDTATQHLSHCASCLDKWSNWCSAIHLAATDNSKEDNNYILGFGLLEAAATEVQDEVVYSRSACGRFLLSVYPQKLKSDTMMITLELIAGSPNEFEGRHFQIRDYNGQILLDGFLRDQRLARVAKNLNHINLGQWTLIEVTTQG